MNTPTDEQLAKLPKWARDHIALLERRLNEASDRIEANQQGPPDSDTVAQPYATHPFRLPSGVDIRFFLGEETHWEREYINVSAERGRIVVHGSEALAVRPKSGNVVEISTGRDGR